MEKVFMTVSATIGCAVVIYLIGSLILFLFEDTFNSIKNWNKKRKESKKIKIFKFKFIGCRLHNLDTIIFREEHTQYAFYEAKDEKEALYKFFTEHKLSLTYVLSFEEVFIERVIK